MQTPAVILIVTDRFSPTHEYTLNVIPTSVSYLHDLSISTYILLPLVGLVAFLSSIPPFLQVRFENRPSPIPNATEKEKKKKGDRRTSLPDRKKKREREKQVSVRGAQAPGLGFFFFFVRQRRRGFGHE